MPMWILLISDVWDGIVKQKGDIACKNSAIGITVGDLCLRLHLLRSTKNQGVVSGAHIRQAAKPQPTTTPIMNQPSPKHQPFNQPPK